MNNDLISREALKEAFADMREGYPVFSDTEMVSTKDIASIIDNAPSVYDNPYSDGREDGYIEGYEQAKRECERPQGDLADEVWKLYEKHQSHLATRVLEFGDELKELLGKYKEGGAV